MNKRRGSTCGCAWCANDKAFAPQPHLLEKLEKKEVVLFVGAGISTENKSYCQSTFYEEIKSELNLAESPTFPELMSRYCSLPDGRIKLLAKIKHRFDYFISFDG